jgi:serine/threonine protein kinase
MESGDNSLLALLIVIAVSGVVTWVIWTSLRRQSGIEPGRTVHESLPKARLSCISGACAGQEFVLRTDQVQIGRSPRSDVRLEEDLVSWQHARLAFTHGQYMLYDQDSTNGTWVNGQRVAQCPIRPGLDQIRIGPSVFLLKLPGQLAATPSPLPMATPQKAHVEQVYAFGDYERVATLGSGGAATVYKAISRRDGQVVAIKVLQQTDPYLRQKFQKELEIGMLLRHPHIVRVYGGGESEGILYIVMEFMNRGTLREQLRPEQPLPLEETITITGQVCDALQHAHSMHAGIYHRDIKPENIFFSSTGQVKLGDFGIARLARAVTRTAGGWLVGTPAYMSCEQAKGHPIDERSDIYSLGVVLYEMATGRRPFVADDPLAVVEMHISDRPVPPGRFDPSMPPSVERVIMKALEKDRNQRFPTAQAMARALGYAGPMHAGEPVVHPFAAAPAAPAPASGWPSPRTGEYCIVRTDGMVIPLTGGVTWLNRRDVSPSDLEISRQHARVIRQGGHLWIEDVGSSNGTFVNGLRIFSPQILQPGDEIRLGCTELRLERR